MLEGEAWGQAAAEHAVLASSHAPAGPALSHTVTDVADELSFFDVSGWQRSDDEHPPSRGKPAYRVVYKALKMFLPEAELNWPNLVVRTGYGNVERGGVVLGEAIPLRREHDWLVPQRGHVEAAEETVQFVPHETENYEFKAWQEEVEDVIFVEMILITTEEDPRRRLAEGRRRLGYLKTLVELSLGPRVLGAQLTEEIGELFDDGHFNRNLQSDLLAHELYLDLTAVPLVTLEGWARHTLGGLMEQSAEDRERLQLACDWYWRSTQTSDPVTEYLELWFVVEAVAMPDTSNIRPVLEQLASGLGGTERDWQDLVGRHFGRRSKLVHGQARREVPDDALAELRALVAVLLEIEFGMISSARGRQLRAAVGLAS